VAETVKELANERPSSAVPAWRWTVASVVLLALCAIWAWLDVQPAIKVPLPDRSNEAEVRMQDFRDALYYPVRDLMAGHNPYSPSSMFEHWPVRQNFNLYQPYHLILNMPFAVGGYRLGAVAFTLVGLALLLLLAYLAARQLRPRVPLAAGFGGVAALLLVGEVGKAQLYVGQINPMVALGSAGTLLLRRTHPGWAAAALALAWVKPQFGFPLAVVLLIMGSWRVAVGGTAIAAAASAPVVGYLIAQQGLSSFLAAIRENLNWAENTDYAAIDSMTARRPDMAGVFFRLTGWAPPGLEVASLVLAIVIGGLIARRLDRSSIPGLAPVADLLCLVTVIVAVVHQPGDILIAVPAMAAVAAAFWRRGRGPLAWMPLAAVALLVLPHLHHTRVDEVIAALAGARAAGVADGVAIVAAWLLLAVFGFLRTRRACPGESPVAPPTASNGVQSPVRG